MPWGGSCAVGPNRGNRDRPLEVVPVAVTAEKLEEKLHREPHDVEEVSVDSLDECRSASLNPVGSGFVRGLAAGNVFLAFYPSKLTKSHHCAGHTAFEMRPCPECQPREHLVLPA